MLVTEKSFQVSDGPILGRLIDRNTGRFYARV